MTSRPLEIAVLVFALAGCGGGGSSSTGPNGPTTGLTNQDALLFAQYVTQYDLLVGVAGGELGRFATAVLVYASAQNTSLNSACDNPGGTFNMLVTKPNSPGATGGGVEINTQVQLVGHNCLLNAIGPITFDGTLLLTPTVAIPSALPQTGPVSVSAMLVGEMLTLTVQGQPTLYSAVSTNMTATVDAGTGTSNVRLLGSLTLQQTDSTSSLSLATDVATIVAIESASAFSYSHNGIGASAQISSSGKIGASFAFSPKTSTPISGAFVGGFPQATAGVYEGDLFAGTTTNITVQLTSAGATVNGTIATTWATLVGRLVGST